MPRVATPRAESSQPKLKQIDEWRVVERRLVGVTDGKALVWLLVVQDDGSTMWKPYYLAEDGITILDEPVFCPLPGSQSHFLSSPIFETAYFGNRGGGKCVDEGEVLTPDRGWVDIRVLNVGDLIYTFDEDGELLTNIVESVHSERYSGEIIRRETRHLYMSFTPAHKLPIAQPAGHNALVPFQELPGQGDLLRSIVRWEGEPVSEAAQRRAAAVGWWLACGGFRDGRPGFAPQTPTAKEALVQSVKLSPADLGAVSKLKRIPRELLNGPPEVLRVVLDGLVRGSGLWRKQSVDGVVNTRRQPLADDVCELGVKLGFNVSMRRVPYGAGGHEAFCSISLTPGKPTRIYTGKGEGGSDNVEREDFDGDVFCIGVPLTHRFIIRQRGCVWLSGNSDSLLLDFSKGVGRGYGKGWRGILFRREFGDLDDIVRKVETIFPKIYGDHFRFLKSKSEYTAQWDTGEALLLRNLPNENAYSEYHGHSQRPDSEVLTPFGWRTLEDVQIGDAIYEVAPDRTLVESRIETKTVRRHNQGMVVSEGRGVFMEFTPDHRLGVVQSDGTIRPEQYSALADRWATVARWVEWRGGVDIAEFVIPRVPSRLGEKQPLSVRGDDYCAFMGWFLSEGWTTTGVKFGIGQVKEHNRRLISLLLERMGLAYHLGADGFQLSSPSWHAYLKQFGKCRDKFIPSEVKGASVRQLQIFFDALMAGDGTYQGAYRADAGLAACNGARPNHTHVRAYYHTTSKRLADDTAEVCVKLGFGVYTQARQRRNREGLSYTVCCRLGNRRDFLLKTDNRKRRNRLSEDRKLVNVRREPYDGPVISIGVPKFNTFVTRQKGCVWVSGNSYAWIGFEELTQWPDDKAYRLMFSCARSPSPGVPVRGIRSTSNPYGIGHNWVKKRFRLPQGFGKVIRLPGQAPRVALESRLQENFVLLHTNPNYPSLIRQAASNPAQEKAWVDGDWNVTTGGMFDDLWDQRVHVIPSIVPATIPVGWRMDRTYDHGQSRPFCVLWWAESNGEYGTLPDGRVIGQVPGDLILFAEWYGCTNEPDVGVRMSAHNIARGILERQSDWRISHRVRPGPADTEIYNKDQRGTNRSPADDMEDAGVVWERADKSAGSRKRGYTMIRSRLVGAKPNIDGTREFPGLFVCERCVHWLELVPSAPRDPEDQDEIPAKYEDHPVDCTRYRVSGADAAPWQRSF